jgi:hypothetical protein
MNFQIRPGCLRTPRNSIRSRYISLEPTFIIPNILVTLLSLRSAHRLNGHVAVLGVEVVLGNIFLVASGNKTNH